MLTSILHVNLCHKKGSQPMTYGIYPLRHAIVQTMFALNGLPAADDQTTFCYKMYYTYMYLHTSLNQEGLVLSDYIDISFFSY